MVLSRVSRRIGYPNRDRSRQAHGGKWLAPRGAEKRLLHPMEPRRRHWKASRRTIFVKSSEKRPTPHATGRSNCPMHDLKQGVTVVTVRRSDRKCGNLGNQQSESDNVWLIDVWKTILSKEKSRIPWLPPNLGSG